MAWWPPRERCLGANRSRGEKTGGVLPYGFSLATDGKRLVQDCAEQSVIQLIQQMRSAGATLRAIAAELNGRGVQTKTGREWYAMTVKKILDRVTAHTR